MRSLAPGSFTIVQVLASKVMDCNDGVWGTYVQDNLCLLNTPLLKQLALVRTVYSNLFHIKDEFDNFGLR